MRHFATLLLLAATLALQPCQAAAPETPKALLNQVERLVQLLRDRQAEGYPEATMVQNIKLGPDRDGAIVVFTVEGFEGGNSHTQYLALFAIDSSDKTNPYYSLLDCMPIGGRGWRAIEQLHARTTLAAKGGDMQITLDALGVGPKDPPNFPSQKTIVHLTVHDDRMSERGRPSK